MPSLPQGESPDTSGLENPQLLGFDACCTTTPSILLSSTPLSHLISLSQQSDPILGLLLVYPHSRAFLPGALGRDFSDYLLPVQRVCVCKFVCFLDYFAILWSICGNAWKFLNEQSAG